MSGSIKLKALALVSSAVLLTTISCGRTTGNAPGSSCSTASFTNGNMASPAAASNAISASCATGWTCSGGGPYVYNGDIYVGHGDVVLSVGKQALSVSLGFTISQTLTGLTAGKNYTISFDGGSEHATGATLTLTVDGVTVSTTGALSNASFATFTSSSFTASGTTAAVVFTTGGGQPSDLTNVVLNCL